MRDERLDGILYRSEKQVELKENAFLDVLIPEGTPVVNFGNAGYSEDHIYSHSFAGCEAFCILGKGRSYLIHKTPSQSLDDIFIGRHDPFAMDPPAPVDVGRLLEGGGSPEVIVISRRRSWAAWQDNDFTMDASMASNRAKLETYHLIDVKGVSLDIRNQFHVLIDSSRESAYVFSSDIPGALYMRRQESHQMHGL